MPVRVSFRVVSILLLAGLVTACGSHLTEQEILAANGVAPGETKTTAPTGGTGPAEPIDPTSGTNPTASDDGEGGEATTPRTDAGRTQDTGPTAVGTPGETGPIILGSVGNYSGPAGVAQAGIPRGVQVWAANINNRGGLFGRPVQIIVVDDGGDPARYASAVRDLVENRGVVAFVGNGASLSMRGGIGYLERKGVPVIGSDCSVLEWYDSDTFFPQCPLFADTIVNIMRSGREVTGLRKFGFIVCSEASACTNQKPILIDGAKDAGVEIVYSANISLTQADFTAECRNAQAAGVELFYVAASPDVVARTARSCSRQGFRPTFVQAGISIGAEAKDIDDIDRMVVSLQVAPFEGGSGPAYEEFAGAMESFLPRAPGPAESYGWASGKLFEVTATNAARTKGSISSASLLGAARQLSGETIGGFTTSLTFTSGRATPANCYFTVLAEGGKWTTPLGSSPRCI